MPVADEFRVFFERHHRDAARLAYLLTGDRDAADDLTADAFVAAWRQWDRVRAAARPGAYLRGMVANLASTRVRRLVRERDRLRVMGATAGDRAEEHDVAVAVDLRAALRRLPPRKRACVVLRYVADLSEQETAEALGISVGTVKSQTSRAVEQLRRMLGSADLVVAGDEHGGAS